MSWTVLAVLLLTVAVSSASFIPRSEAHRPGLPTAKTRRSALRGGLEVSEDHSQGEQCCPAGTHVEEACEALGTPSTCLPCTDGVDYTAHSNGLSHCLPCTRCKPGEEQVSRCSTTQDTRCQCMKGTFCPPDHPCEVCLSCKRCPEGEKLISPCNATSDVQCARPTEPPTTQESQGWIIPVVVIGLILLVAVGSYLYWVRKQRKQESGDGSLRVLSAQGRLVGWFQRVLKNRCSSRDQETEENERNRSIEEPCLPGSTTPGGHTSHHCQPAAHPLLPCRTPELHPILIPVDENSELWPVFYVFAQEVPLKRWREFMRKVGLLNSDIDVVIQDIPNNTQEQHFQMLRVWRDRVGQTASVNTLLGKLREEMNLEGVANQITAILLEKKMYTTAPES